MSKRLTILTCTLVVLTGVFYAFGQNDISSLKEKRITPKMERQPLGKIFRELLYKYDVPIGFEESILDRKHNDYEFETIVPRKSLVAVRKSDGTRITAKTDLVFDVKEHWLTINVENERLEDALNIIVRQMENYNWEINGGVVNIFPIRGRDKRYEELLELNIRDYAVEEGAPIGTVRNRIFSLPEVKGFLTEKKIYFSDLRPDSENITLQLPAEMTFSNLTFRDLLNKITKGKRGGWILKKNKLFGSNEKEFIEIEI